MYLDKNAIMSAKDIASEEVDVPEWGGKVLIQSMTSKHRDQWEMSMVDNKGKCKMENIRATLVAACLVDEQGNRLFTDKEIKELGRKSAKVLDKLFSVAQRVSGIGQDDVDDMAKN